MVGIGGCSGGYKYGLGFVDETGEEETVVEAPTPEPPTPATNEVSEKIKEPMISSEFNDAPDSVDELKKKGVTPRVTGGKKLKDQQSKVRKSKFFDFNKSKSVK